MTTQITRPMHILFLLSAGRGDGKNERIINPPTQSVINQIESMGHKVTVAFAQDLAPKETNGKITDVIHHPSKGGKKSLKDYKFNGVFSYFTADSKKLLVVQDFLESQGVVATTTSSSYHEFKGKINKTIRLDEAGVPVPAYFVNEPKTTPTLDEVTKKLSKLGEPPYVVKANFGSRSSSVFVVANAQQALEKITAFSDQGSVVQEFIPPPGVKKSDCVPGPNSEKPPTMDGKTVQYYRVLMIGNQLHSVLLRKGTQDLKTGADDKTQEVTFPPMSEVPPSVLVAARKAHNATGLIINGVDIVVDPKGQGRVLEVNAAPGFTLQFQAGLDPTPALADAIIRHVRNARYIRHVPDQELQPA